MGFNRTSDNSARNLLRATTRDVHERLHRHKSFAALLNASLTVDEYRRLLARLYGFHRPLEEAIFNMPHAWWSEIVPEPQRRMHLLQQDLAAFGLSLGEISALPRWSAFAINSPATLLGCLYVREGATLGGQVLARALEHLVGPGEAGRSFFSGTPDNGRRWSELCIALDRVIDPQEIAEMIDAACQTFAAIEAWLDAEPATIEWSSAA